MGNPRWPEKMLKCLVTHLGYEHAEALLGGRERLPEMDEKSISPFVITIEYM
jgi:hypothetical protein